MLRVDDDAWPTAAHCSRGSFYFVFRIDLNLAEIGIDFTIATSLCSEFEPGFRGNSDRHVTFAILDLNISQRTHEQVDGSIFVLQANIPRNIFKADILRASG